MIELGVKDLEKKCQRSEMPLSHHIREHIISAAVSLGMKTLTTWLGSVCHVPSPYSNIFGSHSQGGQKKLNSTSWSGNKCL
jgi:hypothetical protein